MVRKLISLLILTFVLIAIVYAFQTERERFRVVLQISWFDVALLALSSFGLIAATGAVLQAACRPFGVHLRYLEAFGLTVSSMCMNYAVPFSGLGVRGAYLIRKHNLRLGDYSALMIGIFIIELAVYGAAALVASAWLSLGKIHPDPLIVVVCAGAIVAAVCAAVMPIKWIPSRPTVMAIVADQMTAFRKVLREPTVLGPVLLWTTLGFICFALGFAIAYKSIGATVPFAGAIIAAALSDYSFFVRLAPGSAGSLEVAVYYVSSLFSLALSDSLIIALLVRLGLAIVFLPLGPPYIWLLFRGARGLPKHVAQDASQRAYQGKRLADGFRSKRDFLALGVADSEQSSLQGLARSNDRLFTGMSIAVFLGGLVMRTTVSTPAKPVLRDTCGQSNDAVGLRYSRMGEGDYATGLLSPWLRKRRIHAVLPHIRGRLLDYGCGIGALADLAECSEYVGVDVDEESLRIARHKHPGVRFELLPMLPKGPFNTITILAVLEYLPERVASLAQLRQLLAPGGRLVITTPCPTLNPVRGFFAALGLLSPKISRAKDSLPDQVALIRDAAAAGLTLEQYRRFLLGANQLFVFRRALPTTVAPLPAER